YALQREPKPAISAYRLAPLRSACAADSNTNIAAPSPSTNPSLVRSNGRDACSGSSLRGLVALIASKHATVIGEIGASEAPATITSTAPSRMSSTACATASIPEVHPVETTAAGPSAPTCHATSAATELGTR